jgi:hypothetical protein
VINAIVAHERAMDVAAAANLNLQSEGLNFSLEPSPINLRGLTHREIGDATPAYAVLIESANIMQGRLRGKYSGDKIISGKDDCYEKAAKANLLRVPFDSTGIPIEVRVGRHIAGVTALIEGFNFLNAERSIAVENLPSYEELQTRGLGHFLHP